MPWRAQFRVRVLLDEHPTAPMAFRAPGNAGTQILMPLKLRGETNGQVLGEVRHVAR